MGLGRIGALAALAALALVLVSVAAARGRTVTASWYGPGLYGNRTACGQTLSRSLVGVAHRSLACGTRVTVCYRGRCVAARVVDRGPFVRGRELDLTGRLAARLRFGGVARVYCSAC